MLISERYLCLDLMYCVYSLPVQYRNENQFLHEIASP